MKTKLAGLAALLLAGAGALRAQAPQPDPIGANLFPPELVMQHQQAIALAEEQREYLKAEIRKAQPRFNELQWDLEDQVEKMAALLKQTRIDEQQMLAQLDKVLAQEREIKRAQLTLLVRIKDKLTVEQQAKLAELKAQLEELKSRIGAK